MASVIYKFSSVFGPNYNYACKCGCPDPTVGYNQMTIMAHFKKTWKIKTKTNGIAFLGTRIASKKAEDN